MDDLTFGEKLKRAVKDDADELLRLCGDSSKRKEILEFKDNNGHCLLHLVAGSGTVDLMRTLIDLGAGVIEDYCNHEPILQTACSHGNTGVVTYLLHNNENFKNDSTRIKYNNDKPLLYYAARSGNIETIKSLQKNGHFDINQILSNGSTALLMLVKDNDCKGVETLCLCGADVNIGTINKTMYDPEYKAIHFVSEGIKNGAEMIQILLKYGVNVNEPFIRSKIKQQPLFMAIKVGHVGNARVLLDHGADISFKGKSSKETIGCFCLAIQKCPSLVSELIKRGANLYERHNKKSVLMIALDSNAGSEAIEALVKAGANVKFGKDGKTVIQCCTRYDQLKSFRNAGISVQNIESIHKVSTLGLALKTVMSSFSCNVGRPDLELLDGLSEFLINNEISELVENEVVDLVSNGADPDMLTKEHDIPLIMAIEKRMKGVFKILIDAGANTSKLGKDGNSPIHLCCIESNWKFLELMLEVDSDLNKANAKGDFPLELAIQAGQDPNSYIFENNKTNVSKDLIKKMLDKGANPNLTPSGKNSPLILAIQKRFDSIVEVLLESGAVTSHIGENKSTAFACCLSTGLENYIKALIENGLPLNEPNSTGQYPLEMLIYGCIDCSLFLLMLSNGANPNIVTTWGESILTMAVKSQLHDLCIALIEAGADVNKKDVDGFTAFDIFTRRPIICSCSESSSANELFKKFVLAGIDVHQHNLSGTYPLLLAVSLGAEDIVEVILDKGEDVNIVDQSGETSLTKAISHGFEDIVKLLIHYGANVNQICKGSTKFHAENSRACIVFDIRISESVDGISYKCGDQFEMSILSKVITRIPLSLAKRRHFASLLLEHGADPNLEKSGVDSCLMQAVRFGDPVLVKTLLEASAETNHIGNNGNTALHVFFSTFHSSAENGSTILKMLLEYGAPTNVSSTDGDLPVHKALSNCKSPDEFDDNLGDILTMIDLTKDLNVPDKNRSTPFLAVTKICRLDVMKKMVEKGADVRSKGTNGNAALHIVMERKKFNKDIISFLLSHGADINNINDFEETPLVTFIKRGPLYVTIKHISFLLENGADPNICADGINSALLKAISFPSFKVATVLIDAKANINHIGKGGNTVLHAVFSKDYNTNVQRYSPYFYDSDDDTSDEDTTASLDSSSNSCDDQIDDYTEKNSIPRINYGSIETMDNPQIEGIDNKTNLGITDIDDTKQKKTYVGHHIK
ncbi:unnamed protein product [Mytilus coruscus]|uniref:Uncharacterized protein n=1 Tax=Mytilus coruscus TaxID=42192 RepID=A0A6J8A9X9_MYTCO|nr:unnamed protein product [Mytilus coruscus]